MAAVAPMDWSPVWISLETSVTATLLTLAIGLAAAAWRERRRGPVAALVDGIFLLPLVLPPTVVGFLLLLLSDATDRLASSCCGSAPRWFSPGPRP